MLQEIQAIADRVSRALADKGQPGQFYAFEVGVIVRVRWDGARRDEADAEKVLIRFLEFVGYDAHQSLGLGVTVRARIPRALDHEACVHNQEPRPETLAECEAAAAE